ncbi:MAG: hypothetical protein ACTSXG_02385 [Alphaproteobacteria bacterium]
MKKILSTFTVALVLPLCCVLGMEDLKKTTKENPTGVTVKFNEIVTAIEGNNLEQLEQTVKFFSQVKVSMSFYV